MLFQKEFIVDPITKHRKKNRGELPQFFVEDTHEAIIPMDEFQKVQAEFKRRRDLRPFGNKSLKLTAFSTKVTCRICGKHYRRSGKRNTAGELYYIWTCQTKSAKGTNACASKNIPEKMLQNAASEVMGDPEFDKRAFKVQVKEIIMVSDVILQFHFYDGHVVTTTWKSTARVDCWSSERRRQWGELHKRKDTNPNKSSYKEFTGFIRCGQCGSNYRCQSTDLKDGTRINTWHCTAPHGVCDRVNIKGDTLKALVTEVLELESFDEVVMDEQIDFASILGNSVTFHFRDGNEVSKDFHDKRKRTKWTEERRVKQTQAIRNSWTEERRAASSAKMRARRSEKKWPKV